VNDSIERRTPAGDGWPTGLRHIDNPPIELFLEGRTELLEPRLAIAIVGTRTPSPYGAEQAARFAAAFARAGACVTSGLARGIDSLAHAAALDAGGDTLAVLGSGLRRAWPAGALTERVRAEGCLVSEYPPDTPPRRGHFPLRNRILSGLSSAVVVIEAAYRSGSLITARWAIEQGREVFALPGRVDQPMARGCHRLLVEGAHLTEGPEDVLRVLGVEPPPAPRERPVPPLLAALRGETLDPAELAERLGRALPGVLAELCELELAERVRRCPGGRFQVRADRSAQEPAGPHPGRTGS
jgi:DNA processing protein